MSNNFDEIIKDVYLSDSKVFSGEEIVKLVAGSSRESFEMLSLAMKEKSMPEAAEALTLRLGELTSIKDIQERTRVNVCLSQSKSLPLGTVREKLQNQEWDEQIVIYISSIIADNPNADKESGEVRSIVDILKKENNNAIIESVISIAKEGNDIETLKGMIEKTTEWVGVALADALFASEMDKNEKMAVARQILQDEENHTYKERAFIWMLHEYPLQQAIRNVSKYEMPARQLEGGLQEFLENIYSKEYSLSKGITNLDTNLKTYLNNTAHEMGGDDAGLVYTILNLLITKNTDRRCMTILASETKDSHMASNAALFYSKFFEANDDVMMAMEFLNAAEMLESTNMQEAIGSSIAFTMKEKQISEIPKELKNKYDAFCFMIDSFLEEGETINTGNLQEALKFINGYKQEPKLGPKIIDFFKKVPVDDEIKTLEELKTCLIYIENAEAAGEILKKFKNAVKNNENLSERDQCIVNAIQGVKGPSYLKIVGKTENKNIANAFLDFVETLDQNKDQGLMSAAKTCGITECRMRIFQSMLMMGIAAQEIKNLFSPQEIASFIDADPNDYESSPEAKENFNELKEWVEL